MRGWDEPGGGVAEVVWGAEGSYKSCKVTLLQYKERRRFPKMYRKKLDVEAS